MSPIPPSVGQPSRCRGGRGVEVPAHSHGVVVDGSVFGGVPLKDKLPVVQVARASALLEPAQVALLMVDI